MPGLTPLDLSPDGLREPLRRAIGAAAGGRTTKVVQREVEHDAGVLLRGFLFGHPARSTEGGVLQTGSEPTGAMPYDFNVDPLRHCVIGFVWGDVDMDQIVSLANALRADRRWVQDMRQLWDCRQVRRLELRTADLDAFRDLVHGPGSARGYRSAIVVESQLQHIATELVRVYGRPDQIKVFTDVQDAEAWLESGWEKDGRSGGADGRK